MDDLTVPEKKSMVPFLRQLYITTAVSVNIMGHGCVIGISAILIPSLRRPESSIHATHSEESWIASIIGFALIVGNLIITPTMDRLGRKRSHILSIFPILVGWFLLLLADSVPTLIAARFLQGLSMGILGPLGSVIIGEMTNPKNRGPLLTLISLSLTLGVLFTQTLGIFLSWKQTVIACSFITFTSLCMQIYCPESPPWLCSQGRLDECREVFLWLRGDGPEERDELEKMIQAKMMERKSSVAGQTISFGTKVRRTIRFFKETYKKPDFYKPIIIMLHIYTMFQFAGINVFSSYMIDIIRQVVGPEANAEYLMVVFNIERLISNLLAIFLMANMKRRSLLFSAGFLCVTSYIGKGLYVYAKQNDKLPFPDNQWVPIGLIGLYMFSLAVGISSIPFTISGELFPLAYRGLGGGISVLALSLNFFLAVKCFPVLTTEIGLPSTYFLYTGIVVYCLTVIWFMLPETKDRTLQEIEESFRGKKAVEDPANEPLNDVNVQKYLAMRRCSSQIMY
ncbi:unnamed protein product [Plutella xylostella]|uniref:(diamondback moth) hypothetical protein n=1 Tax=Plutella xylostella TaxID=51655 RepID=A0A8S4G857_PLUXY|nr:unnamed protein product [Plutella xylostella]